MRVLVTGAAGFLGSHLVDRLIDDGHFVMAWDREENRTYPDCGPFDALPFTFKNLVHRNADLGFGEGKNLVCAVTDISERFSPTFVEDVAAYHGPFDRIYNLACPASPIHYQADPIHTWKTSVLGSLHMLELAEKWGSRILQASTSEVYGDPKVHPQPEEYWGNVNPIGVRSCYDEGKRAAESIFFDYRRQRGVDIRIARIFNTYGPRLVEGDGRVVSNFICQALRGDDITIYGNGQQTRSFCYVDDLIDGLVRLMEGEHTGPINLGNPWEYTIIELAQKVQEMSGFDSNLVMRSLPKDDPMQRKPVIARAKELLGWEPQVQLDEGLMLTFDYFKGVL